jgi:hypothetical protein
MAPVTTAAVACRLDAALEVVEVDGDQDIVATDERGAPSP